MNFWQWLGLNMCLIAVAIFSLLYTTLERADRYTATIALALALAYGVITVMCEFIWRKYNRGPH